MAKVQHYRGLHTDLDQLYEAIKKRDRESAESVIVTEFKGTLNDLPLRSVVAVNKSLKVIAGFLSEIHISIAGNPDDFAVEVGSHGWFSSLLFPGSWINSGRTYRLAGGLAVGGTMAYEFEKHIWKKILDVVKRESKVQPTLDSIEDYHSHS